MCKHIQRKQNFISPTGCPSPKRILLVRCIHLSYWTIWTLLQKNPQMYTLVETVIFKQVSDSAVTNRFLCSLAVGNISTEDMILQTAVLLLNVWMLQAGDVSYTETKADAARRTQSLTQTVPSWSQFKALPSTSHVSLTVWWIWLWIQDKNSLWFFLRSEN